jgi:[ribosomal protein S5]-alanine N-acetyltransferase
MPLPLITQINAPRLHLRPVQAADLPALMQVNSDDQVTQFLPYASWTKPEDADAWLKRMDTMAESGESRQLVIVRNADAAVLGTVLLFRYEEGSARLEIGYVLGRAHWRQGYAREALEAVLAYAFGDMAIRRIEAQVNTANAASNALLLALGFQHEGLLRQRWVDKGAARDVHFYGCLATDVRPA